MRALLATLGPSSDDHCTAQPGEPVVAVGVIFRGLESGLTCSTAVVGETLTSEGTLVQRRREQLERTRRRVKQEEAERDVHEALRIAHAYDIGSLVGVDGDRFFVRWRRPSGV